MVRLLSGPNSAPQRRAWAEEGGMDPIRRRRLGGGAAAATMAAAPRILAQQSGQGQGARFYERGPVRIRDEETGSGAPLLLIAGGA